MSYGVSLVPLSLSELPLDSCGFLGDRGASVLLLFPAGARRLRAFSARCAFGGHCCGLPGLCLSCSDEVAQAVLRIVALVDGGDVCPALSASILAFLMSSSCPTPASSNPFAPLSLRTPLPLCTLLLSSSSSLVLGGVISCGPGPTLLCCWCGWPLTALQHPPVLLHECPLRGTHHPLNFISPASVRHFAWCVGILSWADASLALLSPGFHQAGVTLILAMHTSWLVHHDRAVRLSSASKLRLRLCKYILAECTHHTAHCTALLLMTLAKFSRRKSLKRCRM
mmetsp:Transcript_24698/g.53930  ORF Transcript_24698/g.53930 Transcript_24698/m.53930 type:complete len:282 (+) Transcript_24698:812-1657(+)